MQIAVVEEDAHHLAGEAKQVALTHSRREETQSEGEKEMSGKLAASVYSASSHHHFNGLLLLLECTVSTLDERQHGLLQQRADFDREVRHGVLE